MTDERRYAARCGLYCRDCIPSQGSLFDATRALADYLDYLEFERYAALKAEGNEAFAGYRQFRECLSAITSLECPGPCSEGGARQECGVQDCARDRGYAGCWECGQFKTCPLLVPFQRFHGATPVANLRPIREHDPDGWARHRGPHYLWNRRP